MSSITIQSQKKRSKDGTRSNFRLTNPIRDGQMFALKHCHIYSRVPNVNQNSASNIFIDDGSQSFPVVINAYGVNDFEQFRVLIEDALNATTAAVFTVSLLDGEYEVTSSIPISYGKLTDNKSVFDMLGLELNVFALSQKGVANIAATENYNIVSRDMCFHKRLRDSGTSSISQIVCTVPSIQNAQPIDSGVVGAPDYVKNRIIYYEPYNSQGILIDPRQTLQEVDIDIVDDDGNSISEFCEYTIVMDIV